MRLSKKKNECCCKLKILDLYVFLSALFACCCCTYYCYMPCPTFPLHNFNTQRQLAFILYSPPRFSFTILSFILLFLFSVFCFPDWFNFVIKKLSPSEAAFNMHGLISVCNNSNLCHTDACHYI